MSFWSRYYGVKRSAKRNHYQRHFSRVGGRILDIGCSTGNFMQWSPQRIIGVDIDLDSLQIAHDRGAQCMRMDISKGLSFRSETFDAVNCLAVIEHLGDPLPFMCEIHRILKPRGKLVLQTPDINKWGFRFWTDYSHVHPFTKRSLRMLCIDAGFKEIQIRPYPYNYTRLLAPFGLGLVNPILWFLEDVLARFLSDDLLLIAWK